MPATRLRLQHTWLPPAHLADSNTPGCLLHIWLPPARLAASCTSGCLLHIWLAPTRLAGSIKSGCLLHIWLAPSNLADASRGCRHPLPCPGWHASRRLPAFACPVPHPSRISSSLLLLPQMRTSTLLRNPYHPQQRPRRGEPLASSPQPRAVAGEPAFASLRCLPKNNNDLFPSL